MIIITRKIYLLNLCGGSENIHTQTKVFSDDAYQEVEDYLNERVQECNIYGDDNIEIRHKILKV